MGRCFMARKQFREFIALKKEKETRAKEDSAGSSKPTALCLLAVGAGSAPVVQGRVVSGGGGGGEGALWRKMQLMNARLTLMNAQTTRLLTSISVRKWHLEKEFPPMAKAIQMRSEYSDLVKGRGDHGEGPPDWRVWAGVTTACISMHEQLTAQKMDEEEPCRGVAGVQSANYRVLTEHAAGILSLDMLSRVIVARTVKAHNGAFKKLQIATHANLEKVVEAMSSMFALNGYREKTGQDARGGLEREIEDLIKKLEKGGGTGKK